MGQNLSRAPGDRFAIGAALIGVAVIAAYLPALGGGFVFDDHGLVKNNEALRGPLSRLWIGVDGPDYWPLTFTSFWIEWRLWGGHPLGYHAVNLALHALVAVLLWRTLRAISIPGAWFSGLLFAVHPVTVESVAWISERKNTLSGALFLTAILAFIRYVQRPRRRTYAVALGAFVAAVLAKGSVVMLPLALLLLLSLRGERSSRSYVATLPFFAVSLIGGLVTMWFQWAHAMPRFMLPPRGALERIGGAGWALAGYLETAFAPARIAFLYPPWPASPASPLFYVPVVAVAALAVFLVWRFLRGARAVPVALAYHALMVLPVIGLVDIVFFSFAPMSNHLQYLALMGPTALMGAGTAWAWERAKQTRLRTPLAVAAAAAAALLATHTFVRARAWEDDVTLFSSAVREAPASFVAWHEYSIRLVGAGRRDEAFEALDEALRTLEDPVSQAQARAVSAVARGRFTIAADEALAAHHLRPNPAFVRDVAMDLVQAGATADALKLLTPVKERHPRYVDLHYWMGAALAREHRVDEALAVLNEAAAISPRDPQIRTALEVLAARRAGP